MAFPQTQGTKKPFGSSTQRSAGAAAGASSSAPKKGNGKMLLRIRAKNAEGKFETVGGVFENTNRETGDKFLSLSLTKNLEVGIYSAFDATIPYEPKTDSAE